MTHLIILLLLAIVVLINVLQRAAYCLFINEYCNLIPIFRVLVNAHANTSLKIPKG